jgi:hypothetical protein
MITNDDESRAGGRDGRASEGRNWVEIGHREHIAICATVWRS